VPVQENRFNPTLHRFAIVVALSSLGLIAMGGLVTSHGVGMSVPDWPTSYGYNMFALPVSMWLTGGVFHEHTHRLWASLVGVLVVALTRWLGGRTSRLPLTMVGAAETLGGQLLLLLGPDWKGAGHFLSGIGGVVLLAALVWVRNEPAVRPLPKLGWLAFWLVQLQGLLGGLRVVLDASVVGGTKLGLVFGVFHGCLAQAFLVLLAVIALMTSRWWAVSAGDLPAMVPSAPSGGIITGAFNAASNPSAGPDGKTPDTTMRPLLLCTSLLIFLQLTIGATMRHEHAGLAIPDFPLAHGQWWPDLSDAAVQRYNAARVEISAQDPITAFQIGLQLLHRLVAAAILAAVTASYWQLRKRLPSGHGLRRLGALWLGLTLIQAGLGAWTIWSNKAADIATLHVVTGALTLVAGALMCAVAFRIHLLPRK
jgi:heme a synthase